MEHGCRRCFTLTLVTVFFRIHAGLYGKRPEKRLAYSTVSQVSYILFGLALLNPAEMTGAAACHIPCND